MKEPTSKMVKLVLRRMRERVVIIGIGERVKNAGVDGWIGYKPG